jgi:hypothetical protein
MSWISLNGNISKNILPKTRKRVLVIFKFTPEVSRITIAEHIPFREVEACDFLSEDVDEHFIDYDKESDTEWTPEGWYESPMQVEGYGHFLGDTVTHWQSLPDLPEGIK